jgi:hypothetical protein
MIARVPSFLKVHMQVTDKQVFLVVGHTGPVATDDTMFVGHIIAVDHADAKSEMTRLIGDLSIAAVTSLEQMKQTIEALERVKRGETASPVSERI